MNLPSSHSNLPAKIVGLINSYSTLWFMDSAWSAGSTIRKFCKLIPPV